MSGDHHRNTTWTTCPFNQGECSSGCELWVEEYERCALFASWLEIRTLRSEMKERGMIA